MDITYIPMSKGWVYLVAVLDWHSRQVLAHRVPITMEADFCVKAPPERRGHRPAGGGLLVSSTNRGSRCRPESFGAVAHRVLACPTV